MIKISLDWWKLRDCVKTDNTRYDLFKNSNRNPKLQEISLDDILNDRGYADYESYVNELEAVPDWLIKICTLEVLRPMNFTEREIINKNNLEKALLTYQLHLPNNDLLKYNKVMAVEDLCTDKLQEYLDDNWRMIAVIPQPQQRRPDYVLGKI